MADAHGRRYLTTTFAEKEELKRVASAAGLRATWDPVARAWWLPAGAATAGFERWLDWESPAELNPEEEFGEALREAGFLLEQDPVMDGKFRRAPVEGDKRGALSGAYKGFLDGHPAGFYENFRTGTRSTWTASRQRGGRGRAGTMPVEVENAKRATEAKLELREEQRREEAAEALQVALRAWKAAKPIRSGEGLAYLATKGVEALGGIRVDRRGAILVPVMNEGGELQTVQWIAEDGTKRFKKDAPLAGGRLVLTPGAVSATRAAGRPLVVIVVEGYATGATVARHIEGLVVVAFNAGNLERVAVSLRRAHPEAVLIIAGDNDVRAEAASRPNVGAVKAAAAAAAVNGYVLLPPLGGAAQGSDWNDLELGAGGDVVRDGLQRSVERATKDWVDGTRTEEKANTKTESKP